MAVSYSGLTVVAGTTITSTWGNMVRDAAVVPYASVAARLSAVAAPTEGMASYLSDTNDLHFHNGSAYVGWLVPSSAAVNTSQTTASTSYTDLATAGPAVTVTTGTRALIILTAAVSNNGANPSIMSFAVSGATTIAGSDTTAIRMANTDAPQMSGLYFVTTLTGGSNTFTAKYRVAGGTGTFDVRNITVMPLP